MTLGEWQLAGAVAGAVVVALWVGLFVDARRRGRASRPVSPPRPAGAPPPRRSDPRVDRAFTWATVARVDLLLDEAPTAGAEARFAADMAEAVRRRGEMLAQAGPRR